MQPLSPYSITCMYIISGLTNLVLDNQLGDSSLCETISPAFCNPQLHAVLCLGWGSRDPLPSIHINMTLSVFLVQVLGSSVGGMSWVQLSCHF